MPTSVKSTPTPRKAATVKRQRGKSLGQELPMLLPGVAELSWAERRNILDAWTLVFEGLYAHLALKRGLYGFDVLRAIEHLKRQIPKLSDLQFHRELTFLLNRLKDAHTSYQGPESLKDAVAELPFLVESYGPVDDTRYVVTKTTPKAIRDRNFVPGVTIEWWNGVPFDRAVDLYAERQTGGRTDSRRARGLETLTLRSLEYEPPPDDLWVLIGYRDLKGKRREVRFQWRVVYPKRAKAAGGRGMARRPRAIHSAAEAVRRAKKLLFNPRLWEDEQKVVRSESPQAKRRRKYGDFISSREAATRFGEFGYLRIWSFDVEDDVEFVDTAIEIIEGLPQRGLIIDVRGNGGGLVWAAERLLQLFTPNPVSPTKFAWRVTPLTAALARAAYNRDEFAEWSESLHAGLASGEPYTSHLPVTPVEVCNDIGQRYGGPVVVVCDATTYSSGDLFTAGMLDNGIAPIVCVGQATGAGGACVWGLSQLRSALRAARIDFPQLPKGVSFQVSVQRAVRSGTADGMLIEDTGIPGETYVMTSDDVMGSNEGLIERCAEILSSMSLTRLDIALRRGQVELRTEGIEQIDIYVDGRPAALPIVLDGDGRRSFDPPEGAKSLEIVGWSKGEILQRRRLRLR